MERTRISSWAGQGRARRADAVVVGGGHHGLVAATVLADAGWQVELFEARDQVGGAVASRQVDGWVLDEFSACHPLGAASPVLAWRVRRYPKQVLAFYYPWYGNPATSGRWFHWQGSKNEAPRQSPTLDHPSLGLYDSHDPAVIRTHVAQMKAAGITALIVSWWGIESFEDKALMAILSAAQGAGLFVTVYLEQQNDGAAGAARDIAYLTRTYGRHPAWLQMRARPVLFLYLQALQDLPARDWRKAAGRAFLVGDVSPRDRPV